MNDNSNQDNFDVNRICPTPITSQSSYSEAKSSFANSQTPQLSNSSSHKSIEIIIYIIILISVITSVLFSIFSFNNARINKSNPSTENTKSQIEPPLIQTKTNTNEDKPTNLNNQPVDNTNSSYVAPNINKTWKKYTTDKYNLSFYYPSSFTLYKGNPADNYILYDIGIYPPNDPNSKIIKLRSSIGISINTKSRISGNSDKATVKTQSGSFDGISKSGPYMDTGGILYELEFNNNGKYYYYRMFNISYDERIMTPDEFKQLIESSKIENN